MLLLNLVLCLSVRIVVICVALPFVLPDVHKVVAPIQSADPLFLGQITNRVVTASFEAAAGNFNNDL